MIIRMLLAMFCALGATNWLHAAETGKEIIVKSQALSRPQTAKYRVKMLVFKGDKMIEQQYDQYVKQYPQRENKLRIVFSKPVKVELLAHAHRNRDDDQWYKMSAGNVKRIVGTDLDKPFLNSNFYYEDLKEINIDDYDFLLKGTVKAVGEECHKIEAIKKRGAVVYSKLVLYARTYDAFIVRVDYYLKDEFHKYLEHFNLKTVGDIITPYRSVMYRADGRGKTELKLMGDPFYNQPIDDAFFLLEKFK